jgi:hypothetical protein
MIKAAISMLLLTLSLLPIGGCGLLPQRLNPPVSVFDDRPSSSPVTINEYIKATLAKAYQEGRNADTDRTKAVDFLKKGYVAVDAGCDAYLTQLGLAERDYQFSSQEVSLVGTTTAVVQGLTGVAAKGVALTTAAFGLTGSSFNAYAGAFLFSPDIRAVRGLVAKAQGTFKDTSEQTTNNFENLEMSDAIGLLRRYEELCQVDSIRTLVNQSVAAATIAVFQSPGDAATVKSAPASTQTAPPAPPAATKKVTANFTLQVRPATQ